MLALLGGGLESPADVDEANKRLAATGSCWCDWLDRARLPDHRFRDVAQRSAPRNQGSHLHADRRDRRGTYDVASRDSGRRAQLGLPLRVDARFDLYASGAALAEPG